jgi:hypothetical protein
MSFEDDYVYFSPIFYLNSKSVIYEWTGYSEETPLLNFSDVSIADAEKQKGAYISFEGVDFQTLFIHGIEVRRPDQWIKYAGPGYAAIPRKLFSIIKSTTKPGC